MISQSWANSIQFCIAEVNSFVFTFFKEFAIAILQLKDNYFYG